MKKIMKKILSLALVVALAIAPMTVMAADDPALYTDGSTEILNLLEGTVWRDFDPTENGTLTITLESVNGPAALTVTDYSNQTQPIRAQIATGDTYSLDYVAGVSYEFTFEKAAASADVCAVAYSVSLGSGDEGGNEGGSTSGPGSTELDAIALQLVNGSTSVEVPQNQKIYYSVPVQAGTEYTLVVSPGMMGGLNLYVGLDEPIYGYNQSVETNFIPRQYSYIFAIESLGMNPNFTIELNEAVPEDTTGSMDDPDTLVFDQFNEVTLTDSKNVYWYEWTAAVDGKIAVTTMDAMCTNGWTYAVTGGEAESIIYSSADETVVSLGEYIVKAGETISLWVATAEYEAGTVVFKATFEEGTFTTPDDGQDDNQNVSGDNYVVSNTALQVGENNDLQLDGSYKWTLFEFTPSETGVYKLQADDGVIGYWGAGTHFLTEPNEDDCEGFVDKEITAVGQTIVVGVTSVNDGNTVGILVTKIGEAEIETIDWTTYKNTIKPTEYKYDGDVDKLLETYVDTTDKVVDKAVLGKDGYYHLNSENGEILYVNLNDSLMSLANMVTKGKVSAVYYDKDNKVTEAIDFTTALLEYLGVKDIAELEAKNLGTTPVIYPLTADLMTMFQKVGETNNWYGAEGFIEGTEAEDAWMFACYYVKGQTTSSTPAPGTPSTDSLKTGDNANVAVWAIVMVVAAGAAFVVAESKRRAR